MCHILVMDGEAANGLGNPFKRCKTLLKDVE